MPEPGNSGGLSLIDCDVHCVPVHAEEIVSRLPAYFRTLGLSLPSGPGLPYPTGRRRVDARGPNGEPAGIHVAETDDLAAALRGIVHIAVALTGHADAGNVDAAVQVLAADDGRETEGPAGGETGALEELATLE